MDDAIAIDGLAVEARAALERVLARDDPSIVGIVLTGSAARGLATSRSDVDVIVVRDEPNGHDQVERSRWIDEIPVTLDALESVPAVGSEGAWSRWQYAWARILRDTPDGRIAQAARRQATLTDAERHDVLIGIGRLDEFINFAYRSLKSSRDGDGVAARLDAA